MKLISLTISLLFLSNTLLAAEEDKPLFKGPIAIEKAFEYVTKTKGVNAHKCTIEISNSNQKIIYKHFTSGINTFDSMTRSVPRNQRYQTSRDGNTSTVEIKSKFEKYTVGNTYSKCMSLTLSAMHVFSDAATAPQYLLKSDNGFIDVCWSSYEGLYGQSRTATPHGIDSEGRNQVAFGEEHDYNKIPGVEINLAERKIVGDRLSLDAGDMLTQRGSIFIEGDNSLRTQIGDIKLEVTCSVESRDF